MKPLVITLLLISGPAFAQPSTTTVTGPIYTQLGQPYTGSVNIALSTPAGTSGGSPVLSVVTRKTITAGALSIALVPNDTMTPPGIVYVLTFGNGAVKTCTVPTSSSPVTVPSICVDNPPVPPGFGYANGYYCVQVVNGVSSLTQIGCPGSSGGGTLFDSATGLFDSAGGLFDAH